MATEGTPGASTLSDQPPPALTSEEKQWAMFCHLSAIVTGFLGPLIIWVIKKHESKFIDHHGKEALNFQLNVLLYVVASMPLVCVVVGVFTAMAAVVYGLIMSIIFGVKANNGELCRYPAIVRFVK